VAQDQILRTCNHERKPCDVNMGHGEVIKVCADCWNESVYARRRDRKTQLAEHWREYREKQAIALQSAGVAVGDRVQYFAPSMLGPAFGGIMFLGTIRRNRNGVAYVQLDRPSDGKRSTAWTHGWKKTS
jgi:hypothetical protein